MKFNAKSVTLLLVGIVVVVMAYMVMTTRENRPLDQKLSEAAEKLDDGIDNAARELEDRTPAEKVVDEVKDATDSE